NPARPASQPQATQSWAAKAAGQLCPKSLEFCAKTVEAQPKRGNLGGHSRDALKPSQDTLVPADRVWPWRGSSLSEGRVRRDDSPSGGESQVWIEFSEGARSKAGWCSPQGDTELMAQKQVLSLKSPARLE